MKRVAAGIIAVSAFSITGTFAVTDLPTVHVVGYATDGMTILATKSLGPTRSVAVYGQRDEIRERARQEGLEVGALPLQDLFVHLTAGGLQK